MLDSVFSGKWSHWNEHLSDYVVPDINPISYGSLLIPNVSSIRTDFLIRNVTGIQRFKPDMHFIIIIWRCQYCAKTLLIL